MIIIMIFGENVFGPKYIDIYQFWGFAEGVTRFILHFLFIIHKNWKKYKSMTYTKIKFYIILIEKKLLG